MNLFPKLNEVDILVTPNPSYLHSLWLGLYVTTLQLPEIVFRSFWPGLKALLGLYFAAVILTVMFTFKAFYLLFLCTVGTAWRGVTGHLSTKKADAVVSVTKK